MLPIIIILTVAFIVDPLFELALNEPVRRFAKIALHVLVLAYIIWNFVTGMKF